MKKTMLLGALMLVAAAGYAQESRQDVSVSGMGVFAPQVNGNAVQLNTTSTAGVLASYRYMLTPHSALELNYSYAQNSYAFRTSFLPNGRVNARQQEITGAYVYNFRSLRNFNPFLEAGVGALFGGGVAYELSPSFDIRAEYRGFVVKAPDFGLANFKTNRYEVISLPAIGVAYHF
jgi:outer membrane immunogenic protein